MSVITVVRNARRELEKTIVNVLRQDYPALELVVIDGGSTDGTVELLEKHNDRISFWSSSPDQGIADAMNKGVLHACGDLVTFLNAGDYYVDEATVSFMADWYRRERWWWAFGLARLLIDFRETSLKQRFRPYRRWHSYYYTPMCHQATFFRRELFDVIGLHKVGNDRLFDIDFVLRATQHSLPAATERYLVWYDITGYSSNFRWQAVWQRIQVVAEVGRPPAMAFWAALIAYRQIRSYVWGRVKKIYRRWRTPAKVVIHV